MRRTKEDTDKTVEKILDSALIVFKEFGYNATKLDDIAKHAGMTRGPISWHFKNKLNLYKAVLLRSAEGYLNSVVMQFHEKYSPIERIENFIDYIFTDSINKRNQLILIIGLINTTDDKSDFKETKSPVVEALDLVVTKLQKSINEGVESTVFSGKIESELLAKTINTYCFGLLVDPRIRSEYYADVENKNEVRQIIYHLLGYQH